MKDRVFKYTFYALFSLYSFFVPLSYNIANVILSILLLAFIIYLSIKRSFLKSYIYVPVMLLFISFLISSFTGYNTRISLREITIFKGIVIMIIAMNVFPNSKKFFEICILFFLSAVFINVIYSFFEKLTQQNTLYRVEGLWGYYQFYSDFLVISFFTGLFYFIFSRRKWLKFSVLLLCMLVFFSLILTASRAQIIFVILGYVIFLIIQRDRVLSFVSLVVLFILIISFFKVPVFRERTMAMFKKGEKTGIYVTSVKEFKSRVRLWKMSLQFLKTKYKFFGVGPRNSKKFIIERFGYQMKESHLHNTFIEVLVSFGIFGFFVFLYFLWIYFYKIFKKIIYLKGTEFYTFGLIVFITSFIILILVGFLNNIFFNKRLMMQLFYFTGILLSLRKNEDTFSL